MGQLIKKSFEKLKKIFLYYDSEPVEVLHGIIWLFLFIPVTFIDHGFIPVMHISALLIGVLQLYCVLNCSLKSRKIVSFIVFLYSVLITVSYCVSLQYHHPALKAVFIFISIYAFFNLKRLTIEKIKKEWVQ